MALPTLTVLLDDGTGTFPFDISSRVMAADGYSITRGREDWQGAVTAGQLDLTLNNSDGRFTPPGGFGSGAFGLGGFGGTVQVDQKIRVKETINGVTYTRFTGYVKSWPVTWPAVVPSVAMVRLTATDAQARAERRPLRSPLEEQILANQPTAYYTLAEAEGSTSAGDTSGTQSSSLTFAGSGTVPTFGTGTGPVDGLTATQFFGGQYLQGFGSWIGTGAWTLHAEVAWTGSGSVATICHLYDSTNGVTRAELSVTNTGTIRGQGVGIFPLDSPLAYNDGLTHSVALTFNGSNTLTLYVDGASVASSAFAVAPAAGADRLTIGGGDAGQNPLTGTISHVAVLDGSLLGAPGIASIRDAAFGFVGESGTARITRLAGYAGVPLGFLDLSLTNLSAGVGWAGSTPSAEIQKAADAELGITYVDGTGSLRFHNRNRVASKTAPDLTLDRQWITPDVSPVVDDQHLVNYMEVTAEGTGSTATVINASSDTTHGRYSGSQSYLVQTDQEAVDRGRWLVTKLAWPTPRFGTLTINLYGMTPVMQSMVVAAIDLNCWLRVTSMSSQNPGGSVADVVVQGFQENTTGESWTITCNVVSRALYDAWILDDTTRSVLDSTTQLYV